MSYFEQVKNILQEYCGEDAEITPSSHLLTDLWLDSIDLADIAMSVEDVFDFMIDGEDLEKIHTVQDILDQIEKNI